MDSRKSAATAGTMATPRPAAGTDGLPVVLDERHLAGRWALVTGGSVRGGLAISRHLHAQGLGIVVHHGHAGSAARAQQLVEAFNAERPGSALRWQAALEDLPAFPRPELPVQVVVCNASRWHTSALAELDRAESDFRIHVSGHAAILASLEPSLRRLRGAVVAVGDIQVQQPQRHHVWYLVAKAGLETLVRALAVEWAPDVRCNIVAPGALEWPADWSDEPLRQAILESIPQGRVGAFDELARTVGWLALDAGYITGQVLRMDGGRSVWLR